MTGFPTRPIFALCRLSMSINVALLMIFQSRTDIELDTLARDLYAEVCAEGGFSVRVTTALKCCKRTNIFPYMTDMRITSSFSSTAV